MVMANHKDTTEKPRLQIQSKQKSNCPRIAQVFLDRRRLCGQLSKEAARFLGQI